MLKNGEVVLFRVDANSSIGAGHLMRCIALAHAFQSIGHKSIFIVNEDTQKIIKTLSSFEFESICLTTALSLEQTCQQIYSIGKDRQAGTLVLDGYQFSPEYRKSIKGLGFSLVLLDDENNSGELFADIVINPTQSATSLNYLASAPNALHLLGNDFILLRPEFQATSPKSVNDSNRLLISFGASDVADLTKPVLNCLLAEQHCYDHVDIVTGSAYSGDAELRETSANSSKISYQHNVSNMAALISQARLAVCAAGGTIFELMSLGVPAILVVVADNQLNAANEQEALGWCKVFDARNGIDPRLLLAEAEHLWQDSSKLKTMQKIALSKNIVGGALRVAQAIKEYRQEKIKPLCSYINAYNIRLREVQYSDLECIRHWRNDPDIKKMMFSQNDISASEQIAWFRKISADQMQQHFVIEYKSHAIGVINLKSLDGKPLHESLSIEPGLYIADSRYRHNVLAFCPSLAVLDFCFEQLVCQQIVARVLPDNLAAIKYNQAMGYSLPESELGNSNHTQYLTMNLKASDYFEKRDTIKKSLRIK